MCRVWLDGPVFLREERWCAQILNRARGSKVMTNIKIWGMAEGKKAVINRWDREGRGR